MDGNEESSTVSQTTVGSSSRLSVSFTSTTPSAVTAGELFTIDARVGFDSDFDGDPEQITVTLEFAAGGEGIETIDFELAEGYTKSRSTTYALSVTGTEDLTVTASATIDGSNHTVGDSNSVDVSSADEELDQVHGAGFAVPDSMQDEVSSFRDQYHVGLPNAFVLARPNELYLVFCADTPTPSEAVVSGPTLLNSVTVSVVNDLTLNVVAATETNFITTGTPATVSDVDGSPTSYAFDLVRIEGHHERVSTLYDPDSGNGVTVASTLGVLTETASSTVLDEPGSKSRELSRDVREAAGDLRGKLTKFVDRQTPYLTTFNLAENYWTAGAATVDALVLPSDSTARDFLASFDRPGVTAPSDGEPVLYVVQSHYATTEYESVGALKQGADDGDLVEITVDYRGFAASAQEIIGHATPCGDGQVQINGVCYPLVQDVHFEVGVTWTTTPESVDDMLFVAGLSSKHLDEPFQTEDAQYTIVGEIVSATRFDPSLPEVKLLIVYDRTKDGTVDFASLADSTKEIVSGRVSDIFGAIQRQLQDLPNDLTERWTFSPGDRFQHTAATIDSGYAYVGGLGPTVRAIDTATGTVKYTYGRDGSLVDSTPAVDSGVVVIGGGDGSIYGLDATDLSERWRYETGSAVVSSPTVAGGVVYVGNNRGEVYALDRDDGTLNWKTTLDSALLSDPVVAGTKLYVVSDGGILFALGTGGGLERWRYEITGDTGTVGSLVTATAVYVANERLHSLSKTGASKWSFELDGAATSRPTTWNGRIYVGTDHGTVHAVDAASGNQTWSKDVGDGERTTVYAGNKLLFVTNGGFTQVRDALSGNTLAEVPVGGDVYASPTIRNETVYVLANDQLITLDLGMG